MPVSSVGGVGGGSAIIYIPPYYSAAYKLTMQISSNPEEDVTALAMRYEIEDGTTDVIGTFEFEISDPDESFVGKWVGGEIFRYYSDYAPAATTLRFLGIVEQVKYENFQLKVSGRTYSLKLLDVTVTQEYTDIECSLILLDIISKYAPGFTTGNIAASTTNLTVKWYQKPFWECVQEICQGSGFDCYVDCYLDFHFFLAGSILNPYEGIVHDLNLLEVHDFSDDLSQIKNRVIVYGAKTEDIQIIYTAEDTASQATYGIKEEIVNDENITDEQHAQEYAEYLLEQGKNPPTSGEVVSVMLSMIKPGDVIKISAPYDNLPPRGYRIISFKHEVDDKGYQTTVRVDKEIRKLSRVMADRITRENERQQTNINPNEMRYTYNFIFDADEGSHTNTQITNSVLKLQPGFTSGNWVSPSKTVPQNVSSVYIVGTATAIAGLAFYVSADGGVNWENVPINNKIDLSTSVGVNLTLMVVFSDSACQLGSVSVQYKY